MLSAVSVPRSKVNACQEVCCKSFSRRFQFHIEGSQTTVFECLTLIRWQRYAFRRNNHQGGVLLSNVAKFHQDDRQNTPSDTHFWLHFMPCASLCFLLFNYIFQSINEDETGRLVQDSQVCLQMPDRSVLIADKVFSPAGFKAFVCFLLFLFPANVINQAAVDQEKPSLLLVLTGASSFTPT